MSNDLPPIEPYERQTARLVGNDKTVWTRIVVTEVGVYARQAEGNWVQLKSIIEQEWEK